MVLRCTEPSAVVRNAYEGHSEYPALEFKVCTEHDRQIRDGVPYRYIFEDKIVYMGKDIDTAEQRLLVEYLGWEDYAGWPPGAARHKFLDESGTPFGIMMTEELIAQMRRSWEEIGLGDDRGLGQGQDGNS